MADDDDATLLTAWLAGDKGKGAALIERHYELVERFFAHKAPNAAADLVQRTFLACAESKSVFRGEGSVKSYLLGIARNLLLEHLRAKAKAGRDVDFDAQSIADLVPGVSTLVHEHDERRRLVLALQRIPLDSQLLLEMFYWEELSVDELAVVFDAPAGTIKSRLHRARDQLKGALAELPEDSDGDRASARRLLDSWLEKMKQTVDS